MKGVNRYGGLISVSSDLHGTLLTRIDIGVYNGTTQMISLCRDVNLNQFKVIT